MTIIGSPVPPIFAQPSADDMAQQARMLLASQSDRLPPAPVAAPVFAQPQMPDDVQAYPNEGGPGAMVVNAIHSLFNLPKRALEASQTAVDTGNYDPAPIVEAATLPMGGGLAGAEMKAGETALGAGPIRAYHGTPHSFDAFDTSKIGTGEGAQAYGHGLYFAENEGIAKSYRDALAPVDGLQNHVLLNGQDFTGNNGLENMIAHWMEESGGDKTAVQAKFDALKKTNRVWSDDHLANAEKIIPNLELGGPRGSMYEVNINADPEHFLDWDAPLKDQPHVLEAAQKMGPDVVKRVMREKYSPGKQFGDIVANEHLPLGQATDANISAAMRDAGIPGIKYLDAGSRAAGDGSRNYVVFDHNLVNIARKYGIAGAMLPAAAPIFAGNNKQ